MADEKSTGDRVGVFAHPLSFRFELRDAQVIRYPENWESNKAAATMSILAGVVEGEGKIQLQCGQW